MLAVGRRLFRKRVAGGLRFMSVGRVGGGACRGLVQAFHVVDVLQVGGDELAPGFDGVVGVLFFFLSLGEAFADASGDVVGEEFDEFLDRAVFKNLVGFLDGWAELGAGRLETGERRDTPAALKRRFNIVVLPAPADLETEVCIVTKRVGELATSLQLKSEIPNEEAIVKIVTIFRELRAGQTLDGKNKVKTPSGVLSTAEAISLLANSMALSGNFGDGTVSDNDLASGLQGAVIKDDDKDLIVWKDYLGNVMKKRGASWRGLYSACQAHVGE